VVIVSRAAGLAAAVFGAATPPEHALISSRPAAPVPAAATHVAR
jgi:hypothetical protein